MAKTLEKQRQAVGFCLLSPVNHPLRLTSYELKLVGPSNSKVFLFVGFSEFTVHELSNCMALKSYRRF